MALGEFKQGDIVRYENRLWRVALQTDLRARLDPVSYKGSNVVNGHEFQSYGDPVNISPRALLDVVSADQLNEEQQAKVSKLTKKELAMASGLAEMPGTKKEKGAKSGPVGMVPSVSPNRKANQERVAKVAETKAEKKEAKAAKPKAEKVVRACACGCGEQVNGYFAQGHDARYKGWMIKIERGQAAVKDLPAFVQKANEFVKKGEGFVTKKNYKGEPHTGYAPENKGGK